MATTTPNYGWPVPTSTDYVKDGATAIEALGDAIDATVFGLPSSGLILLNHQTFTSVASVSIGSDASPLFSATYKNYRILINATTSASSNINLRVRANTTDETGSVYRQASFNVSSGALSGTISTITEMSITQGSQAVAKTACVDLFNPFETSRTFNNGYGGNNVSSSTASRFSTGDVNNSTSYNGITLFPNSGNITGSISVYGYNI
jgi:hypothetical protein